MVSRAFRFVLWMTRKKFSRLFLPRIAPAQLRIEFGGLDKRPMSGGKKQSANRDHAAAAAVWEQCVIQVALPCSPLSQ